MKLRPLTGAHAVSEAMRQINPDVVPVYPVTPQTPIAEGFAQFKADGRVDTELVLAESEHSVMSIAIGASAAGARVMTATASQGLALMWELLPAAAGMRLPIVMNIANRALSAPLNIHCDHSDSMGAKDQSWIQMYAENPQEVYDMTLLAMKLAELVSLPAMVMQDGFITSHCVEAVEMLDDKKVKSFLGRRKATFPLLDSVNPVTYGAMQLPDSFFETKLQQINAMEEAGKQYSLIANMLTKLTKRNYDSLEKYKLTGADAVIITTSSTSGIVKVAVDNLRKKGKKVGMIKLRLFRPFPYKELAKALEKVKAVSILDRAVAYGANAPLFAETLQSLYSSVKKPKAQSCVFGLGGRDIFEEQVEKVFTELLSGKIQSLRYIK